MAEIVGLAASILQVAETTARLARLIRELRNAPAELLELSNEATELRAVFEAIQDLVDGDFETDSECLYFLQMPSG
jgi:hypothetical protein